jgi:hypothetical protein
MNSIVFFVNMLDEIILWVRIKKHLRYLGLEIHGERITSSNMFVK